MKKCENVLTYFLEIMSDVVLIMLNGKWYNQKQKKRKQKSNKKNILKVLFVNMYIVTYMEAFLLKKPHKSTYCYTVALPIVSCSFMAKVFLMST